MAKKLTSVEKNWSKAVLHDIFEAGGLLKRSVRTIGDNMIRYYKYDSFAKSICDEIKFRTFNFLSAESALAKLENIYFYDLHTSSTKTFNRDQIANILAAFCAEHEIFWDDINTLRTTVEMETYRKGPLGRACWEFECFLSQQTEKGPSKFASKYAAKRAGGGAKRTSSSTGGTPKSDYKTSGAKSGVIKGLIGEPGEKITFPASDILYVIICESTKTKKQYVFIDPVKNIADPNIVKLGDPSGYTSCKLYFHSKDEAYKAIDVIKSSIKVPDHISAFSLAREYADDNGYFNVNTEIGPAYIKARKLNETIEEEVESLETPKKSRFPEIDNIDVYSEAMFRCE